ncbi:hypothetical protein LJE08_14900, partial [Holdemanella sp. DFI.5.55]|uniref:hypothetical protein n=1 Tax=Holdemanella sp. DFI.5.55 TaxID=2885263 RepID=UPI00351D3DDC|nr:hypothetical protein [Holdemanella sp. DFI.5.55]
AAAMGLSLAVGVAVVQALESLGYPGVELKWPNDLYYQGRRHALLESPVHAQDQLAAEGGNPGLATATTT